MIKLKSLIDEIHVADLTTGAEYKYFILYRDKVFIMDEDSDLEPVKWHLRNHPTATENFSYIDTNDVDEFVIRVAEASPDFVTGRYVPEDKLLYIYGESELKPITSLNVKKIAKQLGATSVSFDALAHTPESSDEIEVTYPLKKLIGGMPKILYHGTDSKELEGILKYGLDPGRGISKWSQVNIYHEEHIFFTSDFNEATFYASNAVQEHDKDAGKPTWNSVYGGKKTYNSYPIVIEFKVPDPNLVYPDYDVDVNTGKPTTFQDMRDKRQGERNITMKPMGASREIGKWSYKGRIPASFIRWVYYYNVVDKTWKKSIPKTWRKILSTYDWDTIQYKLGLGGF